MSCGLLVPAPGLACPWGPWRSPCRGARNRNTNDRSANLSLLSGHPTTFYPTATICLGRVALWAQLQKGPGEQPRQTSFHHRSQSCLGLSWCQPKSGRTLPTHLKVDSCSA